MIKLKQKDINMSPLENEIFLRAAVSNVAELRNTKVKFKDFTIDSYRRSLNTHIRKLLTGTTVTFNNNAMRVVIPNLRLFDKEYMNEATNRVSEIIRAPYLTGEIDVRFHAFFAYNASEIISKLFKLRNYMISNSYLADSVGGIDDYVFGSYLTNIRYEFEEDEIKPPMSADREEYHKFVRSLAFEHPAGQQISNNYTPILTNHNTYIYHHSENMFLVNLATTVFDPDRRSGRFVLSIPIQGVLDKNFLTLLAGVFESLNNDNG